MSFENYAPELHNIKCELKNKIYDTAIPLDLEKIKEEILNEHPIIKLYYTENKKEVIFYITQKNRGVGLITTFQKLTTHI